MASFLADAAPAELARLRERFASQAPLFDAVYTLGDAGIPAESVAGALPALRALADKTIEVSRPAVDRIIVTLSGRGRTARALRLAGSLLALLSGASVLATLSHTYVGLKLATGVAALVGSIAVLVGEHLEKPVVGGAKALGDLVKDAMLVDAMITDLGLRLLSEDTSDRDVVLDIARKANDVAARIKELSVFGGVPIRP